MLEQDQRRGRVVRDLLQDIPRLLIGEDLDAVGACLRAERGAFLGSFFALDPETDRAPTTLPSSIASSLLRLLRCCTSISPSASL